MIPTATYEDTPVELTIKGRTVQYAPMRMEWSFDPDVSLASQTMDFTLEDEFPDVLQIHVTEGCNLRCSYCTHFNNPSKGVGRLKPDEIAMLDEEVKALPESGVVIIMGGEPLLELETVFHFVDISPCTVVIYTNGTLLTPEIIERLEGTKAVLLFSADGEEQTTGTVRFRKSKHDMDERIYGGLDLVCDSSIPFGIAMVLGEHNIDHIEAHVDHLVSKYGPHSIGVSTQHYLADTPMDDLAPERVGDAYVRLFNLSLDKGIYVDQIARRLTPIIRGKSLLKDCSACGTKRVYHPGGTWMNCTNNTEEDKSKNAWADYLPVHTESCHGCIGIGMCGGGCIADAKALNPGGFDERYCETVRGTVRTVLEYCADHDDLQTTNRAGLEAHLGHLLQRGRADGDPASVLHRSVGHDATEAETNWQHAMSSIEDAVS